MNEFYPKIGIWPEIDARRGGIRESLEEKTMKMANRVAEATMAAWKFKACNVGAVIFEKPCRCCEADFNADRFPGIVSGVGDGFLSY